MSYAAAGHSPLGVSFGSIAQAAAAAVNDPCLPELTRHVLELQSIEGARAAKKAKAAGRRPPSAKPGVGLCYALPAVRAFKVHVKHPWLLPVAGVAIVGAVFYAGLKAGKRGRR